VTRAPDELPGTHFQAITWLHISDLHHGQAGEHGRWPQYRERVLADMKARTQELGAPDLILFTGDLSYSGQPAQFERVTSTLQEIRATVGGDPIVVTVPGNHDLTWPRTPNETFRNYLNDEQLRQQFLRNPKRRQLKYLETRFAGYLDWWGKAVTSDWDERKLEWKRGLLPGDFCLTVPCNGLRLGLFGINSAWLQLGRDVRERQLAVEVEQFPHADLDVTHWAQSHDACLLLMHHPPWWLEEQREQDFRTLIYAPDRFIACLFGHMHDAQTRYHIDDGQRRLWLQASSLFGLEHYGEASKESRVCGYDWGRLTRIRHDGGRLTRWKRLADRASGDVIAIDKPFGEPESKEYKVTLRPPPWHSLYSRAREAALQNRLDDALALLRDGIERFSDCGELLHDAAEVCARQGLLEPALEYAEKAFAVSPGHDPAVLLARLRLLNGNAQAVWDELRPHLRTSPSVIARRVLAHAAMEVAPAEAPACWERVIELPGATASDRFALAMSWHRQHDFHKATELAWDVFDHHRDALTGGDLWRCAVLQLHGTHPSVRDRAIQIAQALHARWESSGDDDAARQYLDLRIRLGSPELLPLPDFQRLEQAGVLKRLRKEEAFSFLRLHTLLHQEVLKWYFSGEAPIEAVTATLDITEAGFIAWLLHNKLPLSTPLDLGVRHHGDVAGKHVLLGFFELLILDELGLLAAFDRALGEQGRIVLFRDVEEAIDTAPGRQLLREQPEELERARALRSYLQRHKLIKAIADREDGDWSREQEAILVRLIPQKDDELSLASLVRALVSGDHLGKRRAKQMLARLELYESGESRTIELPTRVALDAGALDMLWAWGVLEDLRVALPQHLLITPRAWRAVEGNITLLDIDLDARKRADSVHAWLADMRRRSRVLPLIDRPQLDLPPVRADESGAFREWIIQAASWCEALVRHEQFWLLSTDASAAELFSGHLPVHLLRTLAWREEGEIYRHHERVAPLRSRKLSFVAVVRSLASQSGDATVRRLHELGFTNAYGADALLALADDFSGLKGPRVDQILASIEARGPEDIHWPLARLALAELYVDAIWKAWCERKSAHAENVTRVLLDRMVAIDPLAPEPLLFLAFKFLWAQAIEEAPASFARVAEQPGTWTASSESPAGRLWRCIDAWLEEDVHRRHLMFQAGMEVFETKEKEIAASKDFLRMAPLIVGIDVLEISRRDAVSQYSPLRNGIQIISALWPTRPLEHLQTHLGSGDQSSRLLSHEDMLTRAAQQLGRPVNIEHDGIGWIVPIDVDGVTYSLSGLLPAALLLRAEPEVRQRWAQLMAEHEGADDGRVVEPLLAIAARPDDTEAMRAYARLAVHAPWRQFRLDPLVIRLWGDRNLLSSFPARMRDLRALLSELEPLPDEGNIEDLLLTRASTGAWHDRPDLLHLLERSGYLLGHPTWPLEWRSQAGPPHDSVEPSFARLERPADQPAARLAFDLLVCCMAGLVDEDPATRERVLAALPGVLSTAIEPPTDSMAALEADILRTAARVVWNLGGRSQSLRNRLWLTWSLHQWFLRQIEALPEAQQPVHFRTLASAWLDDPLPDEPDLLDPSRFGRERLDHRLLAILHLLGGLKPEALRALITPEVQEMLEALSQREPTPEEREVEAFPGSGSCLGWHESTPRTVPGLAALVLASLKAPPSTNADQDRSSSSI
jgi:3',5'-cyclic AMP phosphodiesterase CpdA/tetratricopeptide (TPR) repeat protein